MMVDLSRDFWIIEIGTGQQVDEMHDKYMMMIMMMRMMTQTYLLHGAEFFLRS